MRRTGLISAILLLLCCTNCAVKIVAFSPNKIPVYEDRLPYDAGILIPPTVASQEISLGRLYLVHPINSWDVLVGESLSMYSQQYFNTLFRSATMCSSRSDIAKRRKLKATIEPYVKKLDVGQDLSTSLILHCAIQDTAGTTLYENEVLGETQGSQAIAKAIVGPYGEIALRDSVTSALSDAFFKLIEDIRWGPNWQRLKSITY